MKIQRFAGNFKPEYWAEYCQRELEKDLVVAKWCDYSFEKDFKLGDRIKINGVVRPSIGRYVPGTDITIETLADNAQYLDIEYADYFAFEVDDVDKAQSIPGYLNQEFDEAKKTLAEAEDKTVAEVAALNVLANMKSSSTDVSGLTSPTDPIDEGLIKLYKNNVSTKELLAADLNAEHITLIRSKLQSLFTDNVEYIKVGAIGKYNKVMLRLSNNLYNDNTDDYELLRTKKAVAVANQIDKLETCRKEKGFASIVKGLNVYGVKVIRPKELYVIRAH